MNTVPKTQSVRRGKALLATDQELKSSIAAWDLNAVLRSDELRNEGDAAYRSLKNYLLKYSAEHGVRPPASLLDIGCGVGELASALSDEGYDVTAIDPSSKSIQIAKVERPGANKGIRYAEATLQQFQRDNPLDKFELQVANMTLHAVANIASFMVAASKLLSDRGVLLATVPEPSRYLQTRTDLDLRGVDLNKEQPLSVPFRIRGHEPHPSRVVFYHRPVREYSVAAAKAGLRIADFEVIEHIGPGRERDVLFMAFRHSGDAH